MALIRLRELNTEPYVAVVASAETTPVLLAADAIEYVSVHDTRALNGRRYVLRIQLRGEPASRYFLPTDDQGSDDASSSADSILDEFHVYVSNAANGGAETPVSASPRQPLAAEAEVHTHGKKIVPFGTRLPERIPHALKRTALEHNTTVQELVTEILEDWLQTKG